MKTEIFQKDSFPRGCRSNFLSSNLIRKKKQLPCKITCIKNTLKRKIRKTIRSKVGNYSRRCDVEEFTTRANVSLFTKIVDLNAFLVWNLGPFRRTRAEGSGARWLEEIVRVRRDKGRKERLPVCAAREGRRGVERTKSAWGRRPFVVGAACVRQCFSTIELR